MLRSKIKGKCRAIVRKVNKPAPSKQTATSRKTSNGKANMRSELGLFEHGFPDCSRDCYKRIYGVCSVRRTRGCFERRFKKCFADYFAASSLLTNNLQWPYMSHTPVEALPII
jgi:hypothetical protein